jgi:hypothetical protein
LKRECGKEEWGEEHTAVADGDRDVDGVASGGIAGTREEVCVLAYVDILGLAGDDGRGCEAGGGEREGEEGSSVLHGGGVGYRDADVGRWQ